jgi:hypothetical protein
VDLAKEVHSDKHYKRDWAPLGHFAVVHKMGYGDPSAYSRLWEEYDEWGARWAPIEAGLLKQPVSTSGTTRSVDTVISKMGYF